METAGKKNILITTSVATYVMSCFRSIYTINICVCTTYIHKTRNLYLFIYTSIVVGYLKVCEALLVVEINDQHRRQGPIEGHHAHKRVHVSSSSSSSFYSALCRHTERGRRHKVRQRREHTAVGGLEEDDAATLLVSEIGVEIWVVPCVDRRAGEDDA